MEVKMEELYENRLTLSSPDPEPQELATFICRVLYSKKARNIKLIKIDDKTSVADYFVLATGTSSTHVRSLGDAVEFFTEKFDVSPLRCEGRDNAAWTALDYASVLVHVFNRESREFYNLDKLYADVEPIEVDYENVD